MSQGHAPRPNRCSVALATVDSYSGWPESRSAADEAVQTDVTTVAELAAHEENSTLKATNERVFEGYPCRMIFDAFPVRHRGEVTDLSICRPRRSSTADEG